MLEIYTSGYGFSQRRCREAVTWFCKTYLPSHHITVEVLHRGLKREGVLGYCDVEGSTYRPRDFLIELQSNLKEQEYLTTLFHECVHLMDFCKGDLKIKSSRKYYKGIDVEDMDYEDQPHELHAYEKEQELYEDYIKSLSS